MNISEKITSDMRPQSVFRSYDSTKKIEERFRSLPFVSERVVRWRNMAAALIQNTSENSTSLRRLDRATSRVLRRFGETNLESGTAQFQEGFDTLRKPGEKTQSMPNTPSPSRKGSSSDSTKPKSQDMQDLIGQKTCEIATRVHDEQARQIEIGKEINQNALKKLQADIRNAAQVYLSLPEKTEETQESAIFDAYRLFIEVNRARIDKLKELEGLLPDPPKEYFLLESSILNGTFLDGNQKS